MEFIHVYTSLSSFFFTYYFKCLTRRKHMFYGFFTVKQYKSISLNSFHQTRSTFFCTVIISFLSPDVKLSGEQFGISQGLDKITIYSDSFGQHSKLLQHTTLHAPAPYAGWPAAKLCRRGLPGTSHRVQTHRLWLIISKEISINYGGRNCNQPQKVQRESECCQSR